MSRNLRGRVAAATAGLATALLAIGAPATALACSVCWGDSDSPMAAGINMGIFVLLGVTGAVLGGFIALILTIRIRTKRYEARRSAIQGTDFAHEPARD